MGLRRSAREEALKILYGLELTGDEPDLALGRLEELLLGSWAKGHCLIVGGTVQK